jgi:hypothetical protein
MSKYYVLLLLITVNQTHAATYEEALQVYNSLKNGDRFECVTIFEPKGIGIPSVNTLTALVLEKKPGLFLFDVNDSSSYDGNIFFSSTYRSMSTLTEKGYYYDIFPETYDVKKSLSLEAKNEMIDFIKGNNKIFINYENVTFSDYNHYTQVNNIKSEYFKPDSISKCTIYN